MWRSIETLPGERPGAVLGWHEYNGAVLLTEGSIIAHITHWDEIPAAWTKRGERMPEAADADAQGCVLAWHELNGYKVVIWNLLEHDRMYTRWTRLPGRPGEETRTEYDSQHHHGKPADGAGRGSAGVQPGNCWEHD